jgi:hypothetical protein
MNRVLIGTTMADKLHGRLRIGGCESSEDGYREERKNRSKIDAIRYSTARENAS